MVTAEVFMEKFAYKIDITELLHAFTKKFEV